MSEKNIVLSGVQPTGNLHLGNYLGAIKNFVSMQKDYECLFCVVDLHAITVFQDPKDLKNNTYEIVASYLASGINQDESIIFNQSQVSFHAELAWVLSCVCRIGWLNRMTQFKEKAGKDKEKASAGLYTYPILMASDILLYKATHVPVGNDQKQHLEMTRDIAIKFNNSFGEIFTIPEIEIDKSNEVVIGVDNQKMSKSYNNTIPIFADNDTIKNQVMNIVTDSAGLNEPKDKNTTLFKIYSLFLNDESKKELAERYDTPGLKYMDVKNELIETIISFFEFQRSKREQLLANPDEVNQKMILGQNKAKKIAQKTLQEVKSATGLL